MAKYTDEERVELAKWLVVNAHRLSKKVPRRKHTTNAQAAWSKTKATLWTAARILRAMERGER